MNRLMKLLEHSTHYQTWKTSANMVTFFPDCGYEKECKQAIERGINFELIGTHFEVSLLDHVASISYLDNEREYKYSDNAFDKLYALIVAVRKKDTETQSQLIEEMGQ